MRIVILSEANDQAACHVTLRFAQDDNSQCLLGDRTIAYAFHTVSARCNRIK